MGILSSGSAAVDAMGRIRITGNVTPPRWYKEILRDNGRPDHLAVTLLSDIVYWYRPVEVRDEATGQVIGLRRKFKGDLLQKTYEQYANQYGESKRTIKASLDRLETLGLIKKVFRDIVLESGVKIPNVMYIAIDPARIGEISYDNIVAETSGPAVQKSGEREQGTFPAREPLESDKISSSEDLTGGGTKFCRTSCREMYDLLQNPVTYPAKERTDLLQNPAGYPAPDVGTNTENTSETIRKNTAEITVGDYSPVRSVNGRLEEGNDGVPVPADCTRPIRITAGKPPKGQTDRDGYIRLLREQVEYDSLSRDSHYHNRMDVIDGIINIIADIAATDPPDGYERVNGRKYPHEVVKSRLLKMDYGLLQHVLDRMENNCTKIRNLRAYLITALYNAKDEMDLSIQSQVNYDMYGGGWEEKGIR